MKNPHSGWEDDKRVATAILHDRKLRRSWIARMLIFVLAMMSIGLWGINDWLGESLWKFLLWWGACAVMTFFLVLFALYDALRVIAEEREKKR